MNEYLKQYIELQKQFREKKEKQTVFVRFMRSKKN